MPKPSKREQLLEATKELLWEVGYEAMSPRDIQTRSDARPGSLYHHFPSKLAIAGEALGDLAAKDIARIEEAFSSEAPPLQTVERYLRKKRDPSRGCRFGRLVNEASIEHVELRRPVTATFDTIRNGLERLLRRAQSDGTLSSHIDVGNLAVSLLAMMQGGAILARTYQDDEMYDKAVDGVLDIISEITTKG